MVKRRSPKTRAPGNGSDPHELAQLVRVALIAPWALAGVARQPASDAGAVKRGSSKLNPPSRPKQKTPRRPVRETPSIDN